mmetsp:Transcript_29366/g.94730  ORF Transcript_29366/g.94730 Transcript_29366/m.94730 type:complete len:170 (+) Transcript_29366:794-1303(+)
MARAGPSADATSLEGCSTATPTRTTTFSSGIPTKKPSRAPPSSTGRTSPSDPSPTTSPAPSSPAPFPSWSKKKESDSTFSADLDADVAAAVLRNYASQRPAFSRDEATALTDLMLANVLACATYRWHQFNVVDPKSPPPAKESYREMLAIAKAIEHDDRIASLAATYCA